MQIYNDKDKNAEKGRDTLMRYVYLWLGVISLGLGLLGIPLPLLPTTPFLLLAAWLFAKSSRRYYHWLMHHKYLGPYIKNYREKGGVTRKIKISSITLLWVTITLSALFAVELWWVRGLLFAIALGVTYHIARLKTIAE